VMRFVVPVLSVVALVFAASAAADAPTEFTFQDVFPDVNPCTGTPMTVTLVASGFIHEHGSREVVHAERTITTSDGFAGRGTESFVGNGQIFKFRFADIMTNAAGDRFRANGVFVEDASTGTVRVDRFALTCLRGEN
jgi:hypothetical protein